MTYTIDLLPATRICRPAIVRKKTESITIHWIGPYPKQDVTTPRDWWIKGPDGLGIEASAHFIVKDNEILKCLPEEEIAWHAGCKEGNETSIGIEVIPMNTDGEFSKRTIETLRYLIAELPEVPLKRHYDWTKKDCPRWYTPLVYDGDKHWDELVRSLR